MKKLLVIVSIILIGTGFLIRNEFNFETECDCVSANPGIDFSIVSPIAWTDNSSCSRCNFTTPSRLFWDWFFLLPGVILMLHTLFVRRF